MENLGTKYKRRQFYRKNFPYVDPVELKIDDKRRNNCFHYVPILQTVQQQLENNKSLHFENDTYEIDDNILRNFTDGSVYKRNMFFRENPNALKIILFQDAFEVVNPLGSAKSKYKILGIYMNLGNLPDYIQSQTNHMQLVALCREKLFNHEHVYGKIVDDLLKLETDGIKLIDGRIIKGSVVFIAGNLGSHSLGGFVENFSRAKFFCRYCLISRIQFYRKGGALKLYRKRTIDS